MSQQPPISGTVRRALASIALTVAAAGLAGCGAPTPPGSSAPQVGTKAAKSSPAAPASYAVGTRQVTVTDDRSTIGPPHASAAGPARLDTTVYYPAPGRAPQASGAAVARSAHPFPLVVFGHGYEYPPSVYAPLLTRWASAGFVVVAPTFPLAVDSAPGGPDESDIVNQPAHLRAVLDWALHAAGDPADPLHGHIDTSLVAVAGQSDGGEAAAALAYASCCRDPRIQAAMILSAQELPGEGSYFTADGPPLLVVQGTADTINPPASSERLYDAAPVAKDELLLEGVGHMPAYTGAQPYFGVVAAVTVDFLKAILLRDQSAARSISLDGNQPGVATLNAEPPAK